MHRLTADQCGNAGDADPTSAADIDRTAIGDTAAGGEEIGPGNVADEGKVAALLTITADRQGGVVTPGGKKRAEYVEIAQRQGFQTIEPVEQPHILFAGEFLESIRTQRIWRHLLVQRQR